MTPTCYGELLASTQGLPRPESEPESLLTRGQSVCPAYIDGEDLASGCGTPTYASISSDEEEHDRKRLGQKAAHSSSRQAIFAAGLPIRLPLPTDLSWDYAPPAPADLQPHWVMLGTPPGLELPLPLPVPPSKRLAAAALEPAVAGAAEDAADEGGSRRQRRRRRRNLLQVATQLRKLDQLDPQRVVRVRKISRLGLGSSELLGEHFERWGPVEQVLLSGLEERQSGPQQRLRPSGFGFVVMASADAARRALSEPAQQVGGVWVEVHGFERRRAEPGPEPGAGEQRRADLRGV